MGQTRPRAVLSLNNLHKNTRITVQYTDTKVDAIFHFTDRMTQEQRLPGRTLVLLYFSGVVNCGNNFILEQYLNVYEKSIELKF